MSDESRVDPRYVAARRVLLSALETLAPYGKAVILVGAQAVYLRTGHSDLAIAPFTTDGDLAIDPALLADAPNLAASMRAAGFELQRAEGGRIEPGIWIAIERVSGVELVIPIDLIVPQGASTGEGRRGARLGVHGKSAARLSIGLEAALIDHGPMTITPLDASDSRNVVVEVAGVAALLIAKAHKIHDRSASDRTDRLADKDAADVYRIMQTARPREVLRTLRILRKDAIAGTATSDALVYLRDLFGRRAGAGVVMAQRALSGVVDEQQVATLCVSFAAVLLSSGT